MIKYIMSVSKVNSRQLIRSQKTHEGQKYPCNLCDYSFTDPGSLKQHKASIHDGIRYSCASCNYQATYPAAIRKQTKSKHEGKKYDRKLCVYKVTDLGS